MGAAQSTTSGVAPTIASTTTTSVIHTTATSSATPSATATYHLAPFSNEQGQGGCPPDGNICAAPIPGVYEGLNWRNFSIRPFERYGSDNIVNLVPHSIYVYAGTGFNETQSTITIAGTNTKSFDLQGLWFGCKPADYPGRDGLDFYITYPERCTVQVAGYHSTATPNGNPDATLTASYIPDIQLSNFGGFIRAEMGYMNFSNPTTGNFTGLKSVVFTRANSTNQPTFLGYDDVTYYTHP